MKQYDATVLSDREVAPPLDGLLRRLDAFPEHRVATRAGTIGYRAAEGAALPIVLLHGIGSGAASWLAQFESLGTRYRLLAWDAPGYGASTPVASASPVADAYASVAEAWLDALGIDSAFIVGHSLGAIMAAALARRAPQRVRGLLLCSPAAGYGAAPADVRASKRDTRLAMLDTLGPSGMAEQRSGNLVAPGASDVSRAWVRWNMSRVVPHGYRQATHLLANADLISEVRGCRVPVRVAVGALDAVTPPAACGAVADAAGVPLTLFDGAGHASYIETPQAVDAWIDEAARQLGAGVQ